MKKTIFGVFIMILFLVVSTVYAMASAPRVMLDGRYVDVEPVIVEGRTLLPARDMTEMPGGDVDWDGDFRQVTIVRDDTIIVLIIDSAIAFINDVAVELDVPAKIVNDRTKVHVRFVAYALGLDVDFRDGAVMLTTQYAQVAELTIPAGLGLVKAVVYRVINGATFEIATGERVGLIDVDAPEVGTPGANEATQFVRYMIDGQTVWLESDGDNADRFGILRRYVWVEIPSDTRDVNQIREMQLNAMPLEAGLADLLIVGNFRNEALSRQIAATQIPAPTPTSIPAPAPTPESTPVAQVGRAQFIGNINSQIFHGLGCSTLPAPQNRIYFQTRQEAINAGHRACLRCNP